MLTSTLEHNKSLSLIYNIVNCKPQEEEKEIKEEKENTEQHQKLNNHLHKKQYAEAFKLSLALGMPFKCLGVAESKLK